MKALFIAAGLLAVGTTTASAQYAPWSRGAYPYEARHHDSCQDKARRLWRFENRASSDGRLTPSERSIIRDLRHDLDRSCGRYRHRG